MPSACRFKFGRLDRRFDFFQDRFRLLVVREDRERMFDEVPRDTNSRGNHDVAMWPFFPHPTRCVMHKILDRHALHLPCRRTELAFQFANAVTEDSSFFELFPLDLRLEITAHAVELLSP